ncbi:MAG: S9 family peptidase [Actinobacteria bacterium]|nr:S9 family peptidase [Actinomycetota bacterium]
MPEVLPYGSWPSPITADLVVAGSVSLGGPLWQPVQDDDEISGWLWWSELRPDEKGRVQLVRRAIDREANPVGGAHDVLPDGLSARTRVHEYGGGAWWLGGAHHRDTAFFTCWDDQRLYRYTVGDHAPIALTPEPVTKHALRYADGDLTPDGEWIVCVRETHDAGWPQARNEIVALRAGRPSEPTVLVTGPDFVSNPRVSPDGLKLCWIEWDHPNMPWDETRLVAADLAIGPDGPVRHDVRAVGAAAGSWIQPRWARDAIRLWVISDGRGTQWDLLAYEDRDARWTFVDRAAHGAETGEPQWVFGQSDYCLSPDGSAIAVLHRDGSDRLAGVEAPFTSMTGLVAAGERVGMIAASFTSEPEIVLFSAEETTVVRPARDLGIHPSRCSVPRHIEFPTTDDATAHALFYPPHNPDFVGPDGETPPLLVLSHGGPTGAARSQLNLAVQFWTSRGVAVVDVNYRGSTGYGRAYRDALKGKWGVYDVDDCIAAARHLADQGEVDPNRLAIKGGSAGGFTTLAALTFHDVFAAGSSLYGVADLGALARDTHKFESRYLDSLVGPWPEAERTYDERSPINHTDQLATPLIIFQGLEDEIVPPSQAEMMVEALRAKGVPFAYLPFEGEQHGFRQAANIRRVVESELYFFGQMLGFEPAGEIEPVPIERG